MSTAVQGAQGDYAVHVQDYRHFVLVIRLAVGGIALVLLLLAYFLL